VEAVEQAAVAGEGVGRVRSGQGAFEGGEGEVAKLAGDAEDQAEGNEVHRVIDASVLEDPMAEDSGEGGREDECADGSAEGFVGAGVRGEFAAAEGFAGDVGEDVVEFDGADQPEEDGAE